MSYPDFFDKRTTYRSFEEVVEFIHTHFNVQASSFRVGEKINTDQENQRACAVLAYAKLMGYTFEQTKALFGEHNHLCLALPHLKEERNIYQLNKIYVELLKQGYERNIKIKDFPKLIDIPNNVLSLK